MESPTSSIRRPCFNGEDNGLASIAQFSAKFNNQHHNTNNNTMNNNNSNNGYFVDQHNHMMRRRNSLRNISSLQTNYPSNIVTSSTSMSPRSTRLFDPPHFLESCSLCHKPLGGNRDIFMYRGDTPFCSEECRQEQIDIDEAKEKNWKIKALRSKKEGQKSTSSPSKPQNLSFRTGTVAAA